jgi:hypothetical protein
VNGRFLIIGLAGALLAATTGCGDDAGDTVRTAPDAGEVRYEGSFTVLESPGHGPELCANVADSYPPQCGGVPITNWDWDAVEGEESASGTTWGRWHVVGTYADGALTLTEPPDAPRTPEPDRPDFSPACEEPDVVDPEAGEAAWEAATQEQPLGDIQGLVTIWVSGSGGTAGDFVVNVIVRPGSGDAAKAAVRERWAGPLCIVERDLPTEDELRVVQEELLDEDARAALGQVQSAGGDPRRGAVTVRVWVVEEAAERYARERWGDRVVLEPLLTPVPSD